jgi:hypothetical protein
MRFERFTLVLSTISLIGLITASLYSCTQVFARSEGCGQSVISRYFHQCQNDNLLHKGSPELAESDVETRFMQFCLRHQPERNPVTVEESIEFLGEQGMQVDRSWMTRFVEHNESKLALQETVSIEKERHEISVDDLKRYFPTVDSSLKKVPSLFVWNGNETRIGSPKKQHIPLVIVSKDTRPGTTTVPAARDDAQLKIGRASCRERV